MKSTRFFLFSTSFLLFSLLLSCGGDESEEPFYAEEPIYTPPSKAIPEVKDVTTQLNDTIAVGQYNYYDADNDLEGASIFKWFRADDINGTNPSLISGAIEKTYRFTSSDYNKYLQFEVTPVQSDNISGAAVKSTYNGSVKDPNENSTGATSFPEGLSTDLITLYSVSGNTLTKIKDYDVIDELKAYQQDTAKHEELWAQILKVAPTEYITKINEFEIFAGLVDENSENYLTMGYVVPTKWDLTTWKFALAIDFAYETSFSDFERGVNGTIIHEFGHVNFLNNEQVDALVGKDECQKYFIQEGCTRDNSHINSFYNNYWTNISLETNAEDNYSANPDSFVSEYAATNTIEDVAETFRYFVLTQTPADTTLIKQKKIKSFYNFESIPALRTYIREKIGSESLQSKNGSNHLVSFKGCGTTRMMKNRIDLLDK
jgi:hypothetical protein